MDLVPLAAPGAEAADRSHPQWPVILSPSLCPFLDFTHSGMHRDTAWCLLTRDPDSATDESQRTRVLSQVFLASSKTALHFPHITLLVPCCVLSCTFEET